MILHLSDVREGQLFHAFVPQVNKTLSRYSRELGYYPTARQFRNTYPYRLAWICVGTTGRMLDKREGA